MNNSICNICKTEKKLSEFDKIIDRKKPQTRIYYRKACKNCRKTPTYYNRQSKRSTLRREQKNEIINLLKSVPCMDCNKSYPSYVMDFDHRRGKKEFAISRAKYTVKSLEKIFNEIEKCDVVCSNCHRIRTFQGMK